MTDILESMRRIFVPIHKEGYPFILIALFASCSSSAIPRGSRLSGKASWFPPPTGG